MPSAVTRLRSQVAQNGVVVDGIIPKVVPSGSRNRCAGAAPRSGIGSIVTVVLTQQGQHRGLGQHFLMRPFVRAADVHIFDKPNLRPHLFAELDQRNQLIVVEPTNRHRIEF